LSYVVLYWIGAHFFLAEHIAANLCINLDCCLGYAQRRNIMTSFEKVEVNAICRGNIKYVLDTAK